jgi:hypothetical protein
MVTREEDVLGLDVPVDNAASMGRGQRFPDGRRYAERIVDRQLRFPVEAAPEGFAFEVWHRVPRNANAILVNQTRIENWHDAWMLQLGGEADFPQETIGANRARKLGRPMSRSMV